MLDYLTISSTAVSLSLQSSLFPLSSKSLLLEIVCPIALTARTLAQMYCKLLFSTVTQFLLLFSAAINAVPAKQKYNAVQTMS